MVVPRFLAELKHRNVYRAAIVYAAVGWAILEAADVVLPRLGLPDWTVNFVLGMVLLGFPIALVFAWIFDVSFQGIVRSAPMPPNTHHRFSLVSIAEFVLICLLLLSVGYLYVDRLSLQQRLMSPDTATGDTTATPEPREYRAIAVLPFADMSESGDQAWFAEGVAEELLQALAGVEGLQVVARTSSFAFKDSGKTVAQIADILGVQAVLEGSVRRSGERLRITAQLVDASSGYHIWSGSYERRLDDIFKLQDELARAVVQALRIELGVDASQPLVKEQTTNLEAYGWFIRGRAVLDWPNSETTALAISYFRKAVEADPDYALAWGYLAFAQQLTMIWQPFDSASSGAIPAYERALALDPAQSEALTAKAIVTQILEHDWETAGRLYQRAFDSGDNLNAAGTYAIFYLQNIGEAEKAMQILVAAEKRDPFHAGYKANLANLYAWNGKPELALRKAREALALKPQHQFALLALLDAYRATGDHAGLQQMLKRIPLAAQAHPRIRARIALNYLALGDHETARELYRQLLELDAVLLDQGATITAQLAIHLGDVETAIDLMERAVDQNVWNQFWSASLLRQHTAVRDHPRYLAHLQRMGLDDQSLAELQRRMGFD